MRTLLKNGCIYDANQWGASRDILVEGDRILRVAPQIDCEDAQVIDLGGKPVFPGFIDAHVHLLSGHIEYNDRALKSWAEHGVCAVRDLGIGTPNPLSDYFDWKETVQREDCCAFWSSGKFVTAYHGQGHIMAGQENGIGCKNDEDVLRAIDYQIGLGFDGIKTMFGTHDAMGNIQPNLSSMEVTAMVNRCRELGKWVCCHVLEAEFIPMLLKSGMPEYAHMPTDYVPDELLDAMVAAGVVVTPTLATNLREPPPMPEGPKPSPEMMKMLEQMKKYMEKMPSMEEKAATALDNTRRFIAKGGMVTMGTDTMRMETQPHVAVLPLDELQQLCLAGLGVKGAILAGTINSAKVCFAEQDYGTIEEGKLANLIVSRQFPDESFAALGDLCFVMNKGKALKNLL